MDYHDDYDDIDIETMLITSFTVFRMQLYLELKKKLIFVLIVKL